MGSVFYWILTWSEVALWISNDFFRKYRMYYFHMIVSLPYQTNTSSKGFKKGPWEHPLWAGCTSNDERTVRHNNQTVPAPLLRISSVCTWSVPTEFAQHGRSALLPNATKFAYELLKTSFVDINQSVGDKALTCWRESSSRLWMGCLLTRIWKKRSIKKPHMMHGKLFTTAGVFNLLSNFVLHGKSHRLPAFYGCSTFGFNVRKVICGDLKNTSWCVEMQYVKCQIAAKKKRQPISNLFPQRIPNFRLLPFTTFHRRLKHQSVICHSCGSLLFISQPLFAPRASSTGQLLWKRLREKQRWTARAISPWNIHGSLVLWLHGFGQWWHVNVNRSSCMQPLLLCIQLAAGFYSLCCCYSVIHPSHPYQRLPRASAKALLASVLCVFSSHSGSDLISFAVSSRRHTPDGRLMAASAGSPHGDRCWDGSRPIYRFVCLSRRLSYFISKTIWLQRIRGAMGGGEDPLRSILSLGDAQWPDTRRPHREDALGNVTPKQHS